VVGAEETGMTNESAAGRRREADGPAGRTVRLRIHAFARLRELLGFSERELSLDVADGAATPERVWTLLAGGDEELATLRTSTRFARNGALVDPAAPLADGDEVALLPPVGGG
jgi:molybdopterin converting factor small subunit